MAVDLKSNSNQLLLVNYYVRFPLIPSLNPLECTVIRDYERKIHCMGLIVSFAAVIRGVTQLIFLTKGEALRDDTNNGCEEDNLQVRVSVLSDSVK